MNPEQMSDEEILKKYTTFDPPPIGFDPTTASAQLLRRYGISPRPDPVKQPQLCQLWDKVVALKPKVIKAQLAIDRTKTWHTRPLLKKKADSPDLGSGWSGMFVTA